MELDTFTGWSPSLVEPFVKKYVGPDFPLSQELVAHLILNASNIDDKKPKVTKSILSGIEQVQKLSEKDIKFINSIVGLIIADLLRRVAEQEIAAFKAKPDVR